MNEDATGVRKSRARPRARAFDRTARRRNERTESVVSYSVIPRHSSRARTYVSIRIAFFIFYLPVAVLILVPVLPKVVPSGTYVCTSKYILQSTLRHFDRMVDIKVKGTFKSTL